MEITIIGFIVGVATVAVFGTMIYRMGRSKGIQEMESDAVRAGYGKYKIVNSYGQTVFEWIKEKVKS